MIKICEFCGAEFEVDDKNSNAKRIKYCSYKCRYTAGNRMAGKGGAPLKECECVICGKKFMHSRYCVACSEECRRKHNIQRILARYHENKSEDKPIRTEKPKPKQNKVSSAWKIEAEARKHGMNYGQYYALMLQKQEIEERERRKANEI